VRHTVIFRQEARDEAIDAAAYIADNGSSEAALSWYEGLEAAVASLESMPSRCGYARERDAFPNIELRQLIYKSHRLIFAIRGKHVHVLHVRHVAQANIDTMPDEAR
jgi:plasmid stabilization system protein ParE